MLLHVQNYKYSITNGQFISADKALRLGLSSHSDNEQGQWVCSSGRSTRALGPAYDQDEFVTLMGSEYTRCSRYDLRLVVAALRPTKSPRAIHVRLRKGRLRPWAQDLASPALFRDVR